MLLLCIMGLLVACTPSGTGLLITGYNCLYLYDDVQIELNTHITRHVRIHTVSPDGKYQVGSIDRANDAELFVETTATGQRTILQPHVAWGDQIVWSPDSRFIYYSWRDPDGKFHTNLATVAGESVRESLSDSPEYPRLMSFSPDSQYVAISQPSVGVSLFSIHDYPHPLVTGPFDQWAYEFYEPTGQFWSPDGDSLAYTTETELVIMNVKTSTLQRIPVPHSLRNDPYASLTTVEWSPDSRRILLYYRNYVENKPFLYLIEVQDSTIATVNLPDSTSSDPMLIRWTSPTDFIYARVLPIKTMQTYDLKRYSVETQRGSVVRLNVGFPIFDITSFAYLYRQGTDLVLDDSSAKGPISRIRYEIQPDKQFYCEWPEISNAQIMNCLINTDWLSWIKEDGSNAALWLTTSPTVAQADNIPLGFPTEDGRFLFTQPREGTPLEIRDLKTHRVYTLPVNDLGEKKPQFLPSVSVFRTLVSVFPSPDEQSWLVLLNNNLYRYWLADNRWEPIPIAEPSYPYIRRVLWSPDGLRYVILVTRDESYDSPANLLVYEADSRFRWSLGVFDGSIADNLIWTQCGDRWAPIRDRLAAETP